MLHTSHWAAVFQGHSHMVRLDTAGPVLLLLGSLEVLIVTRTDIHTFMHTRGQSVMCPTCPSGCSWWRWAPGCGRTR